MTGASEVLVLFLLICIVLILPRMFKQPPQKPSGPAKSLSIKLRAGIVFSVVYPVAWGLILKPWQTDWLGFIGIGLAPVLLAWAGIWVMAGRKK